jgi:hypothetical protein
VPIEFDPDVSRRPSTRALVDAMAACCAVTGPSLSPTRYDRVINSANYHVDKEVKEYFNDGNGYQTPNEGGQRV